MELRLAPTKRRTGDPCNVCGKMGEQWDKGTEWWLCRDCAVTLNRLRRERKGIDEYHDAYRIGGSENGGYETGPLISSHR